MRIGIGKSFGSFHVGTSVSTKGIGKGLWYLLMWPFYLLYYVFIWPLTVIYRAISKKARTYKAEAAEEADKHIEVLQTSLKTCTETKDPDVFFRNMSLIDKSFDNLITYEGFLRRCEKKPSEIKQEFNSNRVEFVNDFIERYAKDTRIKIYDLSTKSEKLNKANAFFKILNEYSELIPSESMAKLTVIAEQLKDLAKNPDFSL